MAARINAKHDELTRSKIQTSQLINRLEAHIFSEKPLMSASQVNAARTLLAKTLPDLQAITHDGEITVSPFQGILDAIDGRAKSVPTSH